MNKALRDLYKGDWKNLTESLDKLSSEPDEDNQPSNPLLIQLPDEQTYKSADIRIMVFGQETNNWHHQFQPDLHKSLNWYSSFLEARKHKGKGTFWNSVRRFAQKLEEESNGKSVELVWNNVFKIGKKTIGKPGDRIRKQEEQHFNVIQKEIEILKPNLVVFFSGPNYDKHLKSKIIIEEVQPVLDGYPGREVEFWKLKGGIQAVRTYHPTYLRRSKQEEAIFNYIIRLLPEELAQ
jgi:hypothetical protein